MQTDYNEIKDCVERDMLTTKKMWGKPITEEYEKEVSEIAKHVAAYYKLQDGFSEEEALAGVDPDYIYNKHFGIKLNPGMALSTYKETIIWTHSALYAYLYEDEE